MAEGPSAHRPIDVAYTLHIRGRLAEAEQRYRQIIAADPSGPDGMDGRNNLLGLLQSQHRWDEANTLIGDALAVRPGDSDWGFRMAASLLRDGRYAEAWPWFESRRGMSRNRVQPPPLPFPEWRGGPVQSLLVWPEQGLGDVIQFSRYLPLLRSRGVAVTLVCSPALLSLLEPLVDQCIARGPQMRLPSLQAWSLIGSLPLHFGTTLESIPPSALISAASRGTGIGIVTRGNPNHFNDANRSLPADFAARLLALPGAVSLAPEDTGANDFAETAALIEGLDLVITVDTAVAHLAGSLGTPVWVLLPYLNPDWRWLREGVESPWHPSARLFRQPSAGDWAGALDAVERALNI
jgi:tetratricopeptide (TPR) repeat protein